MFEQEDIKVVITKAGDDLADFDFDYPEPTSEDW